MAGWSQVTGHGFVALAAMTDEESAMKTFGEMDDNGGGIITLVEFCEFIKNAEIKAGTEMGQLLAEDETGGASGAPAEAGDTVAALPKKKPKKAVVKAMPRPSTDGSVDWSSDALSMEAVSKDGLMLEMAGLDASRALVLAAVNQNGMALKFASTTFKDDAGVVMAAARQTWRSLQFASKNQRTGKDLAIVGVSQDPNAFQYVANKLRYDREVLEAACSTNGKALSQALGDLASDKALVLLAVTNNGMALAHASDGLKGDDEVVNAAISQNPKARKFASAEWQKANMPRGTSMDEGSDDGKRKSPSKKGKKRFVTPPPAPPPQKPAPPQLDEATKAKVAAAAEAAAAKKARQEGEGSLCPNQMEAQPAQSVDAARFFAEYKGHPLDQLELVHQTLAPSADTVIFLAGDSSLDNKHWFFDGHRTKEGQLLGKKKRTFIGEATNGYERILSPPRAVKDVAYWMNYLALERIGKPGSVVTINASVEESTIGERMAQEKLGAGGLLHHDKFIRDHLGTSPADDVVVISVGGNDVALRPSVGTIAAVLALTTMPMAVLNTLGRWSPGFAHMEAMFHDEVEAILQRIVNLPARRKAPRLIVACMIYYLDERPGGSWADHVLAQLGYDANPVKLQFIISLLFDRLRERGFAVTSPDGSAVPVASLPLFRVLDGKDTRDYCQRVEPSVEGGRKMAGAILDVVAHRLGDRTPLPVASTPLA